MTDLGGSDLVNNNGTADSLQMNVTQAVTQDVTQDITHFFEYAKDLWQLLQAPAVLGDMCVIKE